MSDVYKKLPAGSSVTAKSLTVYNETIDMLKWWKQQGRTGGSNIQVGNLMPPVITVKNNAGGDRDRFEILKIDSPLINYADNNTEFKNKIMVNGVTADGSAEETLIVLQKPLAHGKIGKDAGVILGATVARIEILDADHTYAVYSASHPEYLESAATGTIKLLYNPGISSDTYGYVLLGGGVSEPSSSSSSSSSSPSSSSLSESKSSSGSSKSTAIVPADWSPVGYTALFVDESPEVRFFDILNATTIESDLLIKIDNRFIKVCEKDSIQVCGCSSDIPALIGAVVESNWVHLRLVKSNLDQLVNIVIHISGVRRGFCGLRFPDRTKAQFDANEQFINQASGK